MHIYGVIIGSEILNGRRKDAHFAFLQMLLAHYGHTLYASFIIKDDRELIKHTFELIKNDPQSVLFSFGGIGSTPDDLTREIAAEVFTQKSLIVHPQFHQDILNRFGEDAYPFRIHMADLPQGAMLLPNPINNMSGFFLDNRFFFVPGFPQMAHPMIAHAMEHYIPKASHSYRKTLFAHCSENDICHLMQDLPETIDLSSLPQLIDGKPHVSLSLSGSDIDEVSRYFAQFETYLRQKGVTFNLVDND
ncbi:MAG: molybdopterin-binding protein [Sulfuricurvum sp. PC08-66]|nr:MAG: molybdopterin-binding protein [Sulfuricurvum sp. PC08-66]